MLCSFVATCYVTYVLGLFKYANELYIQQATSNVQGKSENKTSQCNFFVNDCASQ